MRRPWVFIALWLLAAVLFWVFLSSRLPMGVEAKGLQESWLPLISLLGSMLSLLTGLAGFALKLVELRLKLAEVRARTE